MYSQKGMSQEAVASLLRAQGWSMPEIEEAFKSLSDVSLPISSIPQKENNQTAIPSVPQKNIPQNQKRKSYTGLILATIVIILFVLAGGAYAYYKIVVTNLYPRAILERSFLASLNVKTLSFMATSTGQVSDAIGSEIPSSGNFTVTSDGSIDLHSIDLPLFDLNFGANASFGNATTTGSLTLGIAAIYTNKNLYLNLKNLDLAYSSVDPKAASTQSIVATINGFVRSLENKWIQIDASPISATTSSQYFLSDTDKAAIRGYVAGMSYITATNNVGTEIIHGIPTYHLKVSVLPGQQFVDLVRKISLEKQPDIQKNMQAFNAQMNNVSKTANQKIDFDIWIGQSDSMIYKIVTSPVTVSDEKSGTVSTTSQEVSLSNYNEPLSIAVPQGAASLQQLLQNIFSGFMSTTTVKKASPTVVKTTTKKSLLTR